MWRALASREDSAVSPSQGFVARHKDAVRADKHRPAPAAQKIAVAVEHTHRMLAAIEGVDIVMAVDADRRDIGVELHARRKLGPIVADLIAVGVRSKCDRHGGSSLFCDVTDYRSAVRALTETLRLPKSAGPDGRMAAPPIRGEESPGSTEVRCRVTPGGGD